MAATTKPMVWARNLKHDNKTRCSCCGKIIKGKAYWVEVINGGGDVAARESNTDTNDAGYMGFHPVGPDCARKHFGGFGFTHDQIDTIDERG